MGSDMAMEASNFRPLPQKVYWRDHETLVIERDYFYKGYTVVFEGKINGDDPTHLGLLKAMGVTSIPVRPEKVKSKREQVRYILDYYFRRGDDYPPAQALDKIMEVFDE